MELFEICTSTVYQFCPSFLTEYSGSSVILMCCLMICSCTTKTYQPCFKDLLRWACSAVILLSLLKVKSLIAFLKSDSLIFLFSMFFIWITGNNSPLTQWPTKFGKKKKKYCLKQNEIFLMWNPDSDVSFVSTVISHVRNDKLIIPLSSEPHKKPHYLEKE